MCLRKTVIEYKACNKEYVNNKLLDPITSFGYRVYLRIIDTEPEIHVYRFLN